MKFSNAEIKDLLKAWAAISIGFAILLKGSLGWLPGIATSALTVGIGFLLHELAHKFIAQRYNCWAEFRADDKMLAFAIISAFLGFIFAAPGAVWIKGHVNIRQNGIIAAAGPVTNIALAVLFTAFSFAHQGILSAIGFYGAMINSWLALFNMIPIWQLDGAKVLKWNKAVFGVLIGVAFLSYFFIGHGL